MSPTLLITKLPPPTPTCTGPWCTGFPVHKGLTENSLNVATVWAAAKNIIPAPEVIEREWSGLKNTLEQAGCTVITVDFPAALNTDAARDHDAVFIRDSGVMCGKYWIKAHFSVPERRAEADYYANYLQQNFNKTIINLPAGAYLEGGDVWYIQTTHGSYYFGGLSRSNAAAHEFVKEIIKPDYFFIIDSSGYHIDTVFTPILDAQNNLIALLISQNTLSQKSLQDLKTLGIELIFTEAIDGIGTETVPGTLALNGLALPGKLINAHNFQTPGIEQKLEELHIDRYITPLTQFAYAGGSVHCLTNELQ